MIFELLLPSGRSSSIGVLLILSILGILISVSVNSYPLFNFFFSTTFLFVIIFFGLKGASLIQEVKTKNILPKEEYSKKDLNIVNNGTLNLSIIENAKFLCVKEDKKLICEEN